MNLDGIAPVFWQERRGVENEAGGRQYAVLVLAKGPRAAPDAPVAAHPHLACRLQHHPDCAAQAQIIFGIIPLSFGTVLQSNIINVARIDSARCSGNVGKLLVTLEGLSR